MRKVLRKVKSQWVVLGVMGTTVVALGSTNVQQVSAAEVEGIVTNETVESSSELLGTNELPSFSMEETVFEEIPYAIVEVSDSNLEKGKTEVQQAGVNGTQSNTYAVTYIDGIETSRTLISSLVTTAPTDEIVAVGTEDVTAPVIDVASLTVSQVAVSEGETITVSARITDDAGVASASMSYLSPITGKIETIVLYKNEVSGLLEGNLMVTNATELGVWKCSNIDALDINGNSASISNSSIDLSGSNFTVTGTNIKDVTAPEIESIQVSQIAAVPGDTLTISMKATDDEGVSRGRAVYYTPSRRFYDVDLYLNESNGLFEGAIPIDSSYESGSWTIALVYAYDTSDNERYIGHYSTSADFTVRTLTTEASVILKALPYETLTVEDATLLVGETKVAQSGVDGTTQETYAVTLIDGVETKRELIKTTTITAPINKIIKVGPQPVESENAAIGAILTTSTNFDRTHYIADDQTTIKNNYANGAPGLQWVQLDLGTSYDLNAIQLWHYYTDGRSYRDVVVQLSNDEIFNNGVVTVFNNDKDGSAGLGVGTDSEYSETSEGKKIGFVASSARYARFYSNGSNVNGWNHYIEIKVYGTEITEPPIELLPTFNVARDAILTTSSNFDRTHYIADGQTTTKNNYANGAPGLQWVQMDLGSDYDLNAVQLWHYYADGRSYRDVIVQLSNDETFNNGVVTVFNNDKDGSAGLGTGVDGEYIETSEGKIIGFAPTSARYARFYSNGSNVNGWNHYIEIKVYGAESEKTPVTTNVANGATLTTSANFDRTNYIADGQTTTTNNYANGIPGLQWVQMDLGAAYDLNAIQLWHYYADGRSYRDVVVQLSNDETFTNDVVTVFNNDKDGSAGLGLGTESEYSETSVGKIIIFDNMNARYLRFYSNGSEMNGWNHYVEIKVFGVEPLIKPPIDMIIVNETDLSGYNIILGAVQEEHYTEASWATYQEVLRSNAVTIENTQAEVDSASVVILDAQSKLAVSVKNIIVSANNQVEGNLRIRVTNFDAENNIMLSTSRWLENPAVVEQGKTLQMAATILPENATIQTVTWSTEYLTTIATINDTGLLTTSDNSTGAVIVKAAANDGFGVVGSKAIIIARPISIRGYAGNDIELVIPKVIIGSSVKTYIFAYDSYSYQADFQITKLGYTEMGMITSIRDYAFIEKNFTSVVIPDTVKHIGNYAFRNSKLASLEIPYSVTSIGDHAFYGSQQLSKIIIGKNVSVGRYMLTENNNFQNAYLVGGAGTYNKTQDGEWLKYPDSNHFE